jgi:2-polyprenyl-6-methoxyphenol hydroxylase-like FAD-dependent oxidoreductase
VSGASVAGPVLAYWLARYGFEVTVVERAPELRKTGGHAVDLFEPAMEISQRMGVLPAIEELATGTETMTVLREGVARPVSINVGRIFRSSIRRHVEIMRDDLSELYFDAGRDQVEYLFDNSITAIGDDGEVSFEHAPPRRFDIVVGADGLHSNVRRLVFGPESEFSTFIGGHLAVLSVPKDMAEDGVIHAHLGPGRMAAVYTARKLDDARVIFLFRTDTELDYHHRDVPRQRELLREAFAGQHQRVDRFLAELDDTPAFYFDSITQLRLDTWSRGRVTLVGDAGYCPGPAVGGSTSLAVVGAYVLAGELAEAGGDHRRAFPAYERDMADMVLRSRSFAVGAAKRLVPGSRAGTWALANVGRLLGVLPAGVIRKVMKTGNSIGQVHAAMPVRDYMPSSK